MKLLASAPTGFDFYFSERVDGDARDAPRLRAALSLARKSDVLVPMLRLSQVHSREIITVKESPMGAAPIGDFVNIGQGDAIVSSTPGVAAAVLVADCVPIGIYDRALDLVAVVHAGWRGVGARIVTNAVATMRELGAQDLTAFLGPHARSCCYEFSPNDIEELSISVGCNLAARTRSGQASLDLERAIAFQLERLGIALDRPGAECTICGPGYFSYRGGDLKERGALVVLPPTLS